MYQEIDPEWRAISETGTGCNSVKAVRLESPAVSTRTTASYLPQVNAGPLCDDIARAYGP